MSRSVVLLSFLAAICSGCTGIPASGSTLTPVPSKTEDKPGHLESKTDFPYELVALSPVAAQITNEGGNNVLSQSFSDRRAAADIRLGIGDIVGVTIYESVAGGLFIPAEAGSRAGNFVTLPNQVVDRAGFISVPYAGAIKAAGNTPAQVQDAIVAKLNGRAIEPQAVVSIVEQRSQLVSVLGEVNQPVRVPVTASGERLLDSVARAGGIRGNGVDLWLRLIRNGKERQIHFTKLTSDPRNNIYTLPNDTIYLYRDPLTFLAFGASGAQGQFGFDAESINLTEAVAKAGGLLDDRAEPKAVFLYRRESREIARSLNIDLKKYPGAQQIPVIYNLNLREPQGYFTASKVQMRNKDVIFVSNASTIETTKLLQLLRIGVAAIRETNAGTVEIGN